MLIANNIGAFWSEIEGKGFDGIGTVIAWISVLAFAFQIYFDFMILGSKDRLALHFN